jgi:integrase
MVPKKAAAPEETYATTLNEVLTIMDLLEKEGEKRACAAIALMFFAGLRPGEARGACWEDYDSKRLFARRAFGVSGLPRQELRAVPNLCL